MTSTKNSIHADKDGLFFRILNSVSGAHGVSQKGT